MRDTLRHTLIVTWLTTLPLFKQPFAVLIMILVAMLPAFFAWVFLGHGMIPFMLVGGMVALVAFAGITISYDVWSYKHMLKIQDMFVASPVSQLAYSLGLSLSNLVTSLPAAALFCVIFVLVTGANPLVLPLTLPPLVLVWLNTTSIGFFLGTYIANPRYIGPFTSGIGIFLMFIPPVYYPPVLLPPILKEVLSIFPTATSANILRGVLGLTELTVYDAIVNLLQILLITLLFTLLVYRRAKWRETD